MTQEEQVLAMLRKTRETVAQHEPDQPVIEVQGGFPRRETYFASMKEYRAAMAWWKAATKDERSETTIDTLEWEFLSGVECWSITKQLINTGQIPRDQEYEAVLKRNRERLRLSGAA